MVWLVAPLLFVTACGSAPVNSVPVSEERAAHTAALSPATTGPIAQFADRLAEDLDGGDSAYWLIASSTDALISRLALFDSVRTSLDVQYFIWQDDASGYLLLDRLIDAADRGVRVRLLVDDVSAFKQDEAYAAIVSHPQIEMRTFNPWRARSRIVRGFEFLARADTLNHRLHNKSIIADGRVAMLGGRNIGDRYFGIYDVFVQNDLDILFAGPAVTPIIENFDAFWNAELAIPIETYLKPRRSDLTLPELRERLSATIESSTDRLAEFPVARTDWDGWFDARRETYAAGAGRLIEDVPEVPHSEPRHLAAELERYLAMTQHELILSTAYLIPDTELLALLGDIAARGARVLLLTNSIQSNNHMLAHVAYKRWRHDLLRLGIELYELKPDGPLLDAYSVDPVEPGFMGLHSKAAVVDGRYAFVGTPNLDPRSLDLNMESGVVVDSIELSARLRALILEAANPQNAWRLELDDRDEITWTDEHGTSTGQPVKGFGQRIMQFLYSLLPLKNQA